MTTKSDKRQPQQDCNLRVVREEARTKLAGFVAKGKELLAKPIQNQQQLDEERHDYRVWDDFNAEYLRRSFTTDELHQEYSHTYGGVVPLSPSFEWLVDDQQGRIARKVTRLESIIGRLELIPEEVGAKNGGEKEVQPDSGSSEISGCSSNSQLNEGPKVLKQRIQAGSEIASRALESEEQLKQCAEEYRLWDEWNSTYVYTLFDSREEGNIYSNETSNAGYGYSDYSDLSIALQATCLKTAIGEKIVRLRSLVSRYPLIEASLQKGSKSKTSDVRTSSKNVFIVHGRDVGIRAQVEAFLRRLKLEPIILQDMPNMGQSLLGKIRTNSGVAYAVVLLTGDDEGRLNVVGNKNASPELKPRARQNVVFELGFFLAQLGDGHVAALCQDGIEIPSDFLGIMYIPWDENGNWRGKLITELKTAGLAVDANNAF